jgi:hypothetical protein
VVETTKVTPKSNKLSNNKKNEYWKRLGTIENRIHEIDEELSKDLEYQEINKLTDEKDSLEMEYLEIAQLLEE